jgi:hypothetical protein
VIDVFKLFFSILALIVCGATHAQVSTFPFSETFDCPESVQVFTGDTSGTGWGNSISGCPEWGQMLHATTDPQPSDGVAYGSLSRIHSLDNYSGGGGGNGVGIPVGSGRSNNNGSPIILRIEPASQLWVRFYMRYPLGFSWVDGQPYYKKLLRFRGIDLNKDPDGIADQIFVFRNQQGSDIYYAFSAYGGEEWGTLGGSCGWTCVMGGSLGDGQWHSYEAHIKAGDPGLIQGWINGNLVFSHEVQVNAPKGFGSIEVHGNQATPNNGMDLYVSYDDFVVTNETPGNRDALGNPMIGPIGWVRTIQPHQFILIPRPGLPRDSRFPFGTP